MKRLLSLTAAIVAVSALAMPANAAIFGSRSVTRTVVRQPVIRQRVVVQQQIVAAPIVAYPQAIIAAPQFVAPVYSGQIIQQQQLNSGCNSFFAR